MSLYKLFFAVLAFGRISSAQSTCSADSPCKEGCCNQYGNCGFGPDYCSSDVCISTCDAVAECGQYAAAGDELCPLNVCCSQYGFCGTTEDFCGDGCQSGCAAVTEPSCGGSSSAQRYIGYYESFNLQHACDTLRPSDIDAKVWTHLNYAFALIGSDGTLTTMDDNDPELYAEFVGLKDQNPSLKTFLSVGGWDAGGQVFSNMVAHTFTRTKFINSAISTIQQYGFDGIDIDWEYPVADDRGGVPADKENFVQFLKELKAACGTQYGLTATIPSSYWYMRGFDLNGMAQYIDWFNFMSYDIHGTWDGDSPYTQRVVNPHTNLTDIATGLDLLWRNNIDPGQVCLGLGFYGRSFTLSDPSCNTPGCPFAGNGGGTGGGAPGECTGVSGTLSDYEMARILASDSPNRVYNAEAGVNWMTWNTNQWVSFDDGQTLNQKAAFANGKCMGGTFAWAVDLGGPGSLQNPNTLGPNDMGLTGAPLNGTGGGQNSTGGANGPSGSTTVVTTTGANGQQTLVTETIVTITTTGSNGQPTTITGTLVPITTTDSQGHTITEVSVQGPAATRTAPPGAVITTITTVGSDGKTTIVVDTLVPVTATNAQGNTITSTSTEGAVIPPNGGHTTSAPGGTTPTQSSPAPTSTGTIGPGPVSTNGHCQGPDCKNGQCTGLLCVAIGCTGSDCDGNGNCIGPACRKTGCIGSGCTNGRCTGDTCQTSGCLGSDCDSDNGSDHTGTCFGLNCISLGCIGLDCGTSGSDTGVCLGPDCAEVSCTGPNCVDGSCTGPGCTSTGTDSGGDSECDEPETANDCTITVSSYIPTSATTYTTTQITHCTTITACEVTPLTTTTTTTGTSTASQPFCTPNCPGCSGGTKKRRSLDSPSRLRVTRKQELGRKSLGGLGNRSPSSNITTLAKRTMPFAPAPASINSYYSKLAGNSRTIIVEHAARGVTGRPSSQMITFGDADQYVLVGGLVGCTSVIVTSRKGAYVSHLWERPAFSADDPAQVTFQADVINFLQSDLGNTANQGGIFADSRTTKVFIMTPAPSTSDIQVDDDGTDSLTNGNNPMKYGGMYDQIVTRLQSILPNNVPITPFVYRPQRDETKTDVDGTAYGKAVLLFSNNQENDPSNAGTEYDVPKNAWQCVMQAAKMGQDVWTTEGTECLFDPGDCDDTDCPDGTSGQCVEDHGTGGGACQCLTTITPSAPTAGSSCELGASGACAGMDCPSGASGQCTEDHGTGGGECECLTTPSSRRLRWLF